MFGGLEVFSNMKIQYYLSPEGYRVRIADEEGPLIDMDLSTAKELCGGLIDALKNINEKLNEDNSEGDS